MKRVCIIRLASVSELVFTVLLVVLRGVHSWFINLNKYQFEMGEKWLRPLSSGEAEMEFFHQQGCVISSYLLTINSTSPLQVSHLHKALIHLFRKVPTLRCCIRTRKEEDKQWFAEMPKEIIDLQVLDETDPIKEHESMTVHNYDVFHGPLWCVRLIPAKKDTPCPMPDVGQTYAHQYYLVFGLHHAISDGSSTMRILGLLITILNDVIAGNTVDDSVQLAEHVSPCEIEQIMEKVTAEMRSRPEYLKACEEKYLKMTANKPLLFEAYPQPKEETPQTLTITRDLDEATTTRFLQKCKAEGVTFHTAISAVCNVAIVDLLLEKGIEKNSYPISAFHAINMRRYWTKTKKDGLGLHSWLIKFCTDTPRNSVENFWKYSKGLHEEFYQILNSNSIFHENCIARLSMENYQKENPSISLEDIPNDLYYLTTNMGVIDDYFPVGKNLQATHIIRSTSNHKFQTIWSIVAQTFRGRFLCGLDYKSTSVSREIALLYIDKIFEYLKIFS